MYAAPRSQLGEPRVWRTIYEGYNICITKNSALLTDLSGFCRRFHLQNVQGSVNTPNVSLKTCNTTPENRTHNAQMACWRAVPSDSFAGKKLRAEWSFARSVAEKPVSASALRDVSYSPGAG